MFKIKGSVIPIGVDVHIPKYVLDTLGMGPKDPVLDHFDKKALLCEVDLLLEFGEKRVITEDQKNDIEASTVAYIKQCQKQAPHKNEVLTKKFLKDNMLLAVPMDKGNGYAIMKKSDYESKMSDVLKCRQFRKWINLGKMQKGNLLMNKN